MKNSTNTISKTKKMNQEKAVIDILEHLSLIKGKNMEMTPREVLSQWINPSKDRRYMPEITSVRRAMTDLTGKGMLIKLDKTKISETAGRGSPEHLWKMSDILWLPIDKQGKQLLLQLQM